MGDLLRVAVVLATLLVLAGCGSAASSGTDRRADVEAMIRSQLPESAQRNLGEAILVNRVTCVDKGDGEYDCVAGVSATDGAGGLQGIDVPVTAACDEQNCTWRTTG